jgi:hypothetical protein
MSCVIPQNQPIHAALMAKAASYPADQPFKTKAYKATAEKLRTEDFDFFAWFGTDQYYDVLDTFGLSAREFIDTYCLDWTLKQKQKPVADAPVTCAVPANKPIYDALLAKAASYPADKVYQAKAYKKAAETVRTYKQNIPDDCAKYGGFYMTRYDGVGRDIHMARYDGIGRGIEDFIYQFIKTLKPVEVKKNCKHDSNEPLYQALVAKAASYPKDEPYKAKHYTKAAEKVAAHIYSLPSAYSLQGYIAIQGFGGDSVTSFIWNFLCTPEKSAREPTEDEKITSTIQGFCVAKGYKYSDDLVAEYKAWRPTANQWVLEKWCNGSKAYISRSLQEIVLEWTRYYSKGIKQQERQKQLSKVVAKYCKKENIQYSSEMESKFQQWLKDPANKKHIVATYTYTTNGHSSTSEWHKTPYACVTNWFRTLKKIVSLPTY